MSAQIPDDEYIDTFRKGETNEQFGLATVSDEEIMRRANAPAEDFIDAADITGIDDAG